MGLFSFLFGKKDKELKEKVTILAKETYNIDDDVSVTFKTISKQNEKTKMWDKRDELHKTATQLKKEKRFSEGIDLLYEAIELKRSFYKTHKTHYTDADADDYSATLFRIAYFHQLNKEWDKSWNVLQKALDTANVNDNEQYYNTIANVFTEQTKHLKREKNLKEYLYHYSMSFYANIIKEMLYPAVWNPNRYFEDEKVLYDEFDIKPLKNEELKKLYIKFNVDFLNSKKDDILKLYEYLSQKKFEFNTDLRDKKILGELLSPLHFLELSNLYNEKLSNKLINFK
jgi:hypothetical protein